MLHADLFFRRVFNLNIAVLNFGTYSGCQGSLEGVHAGGAQEVPRADEEAGRPHASRCLLTGFSVEVNSISR